MVWFADASKLGYASCIYVKTSYVDGSVDARLILGKTRVAPILPQTIPRLELLAALILARTMKQVADTLSKVMEIKDVFYLTDSEVVYQWIKNENRTYSKFVENRVREIRNLTKVHQWRHLPGKENIADIGSRGCDLKKLAEKKEWFEGPDWLKLPPAQWPKSEKIEDDNVAEIKNVEELCVLKTSGQIKENEEAEADIEKIIDSSRYSSIQKLLRITILVLRFIKKCRGKKENDEIHDETVEVKELWMKSLQKKMEKERNFDKTKVSLGAVKDVNGIYRNPKS